MECVNHPLRTHPSLSTVPFTRIRLCYTHINQSPTFMLALSIFLYIYCQLVTTLLSPSYSISELLSLYFFSLLSFFILSYLSAWLTFDNASLPIYLDAYLRLLNLLYLLKKCVCF